EIGHYLSLKHTFECGKGDCDQKVCQGQGASHNGWSAPCADVCPQDKNYMSYSDLGIFSLGGEFDGQFTQCQIDHMNFELYDPRGDRGHVLGRCAQNCADLAKPCRDACTGTRDACRSACDTVDATCEGGCATAGDACRGTCEATGDTCRAGCETI